MKLYLVQNKPLQLFPLQSESVCVLKGQAPAALHQHQNRSERAGVPRAPRGVGHVDTPVAAVSMDQNRSQLSCRILW